MLEWRPTLDPDDHVRSIEAGSLGTRRLVDDDRDGAIDEERLNGEDDDGDGEIDEDLGLFSQQLVSSEYVDDRPEAAYVSSGGESHHALGLSVHEDAYAWSVPGYDGIAGFQFRITNHGERALRNVYIGVFADLDSRLRSDRGGHLNDKIAWRTYARTISEGTIAHHRGREPVHQVLLHPAHGDHTHRGRRRAWIQAARGGDHPARAHHRSARLRRARVRARARGRDVPYRRVHEWLVSRAGAACPRSTPIATRRSRGASRKPRTTPPRTTRCWSRAVRSRRSRRGSRSSSRSRWSRRRQPDSLAAAMANAAFLRNGFTLNRLPDQQAPVGNSSGFQFGATGINGHECASSRRRAGCSGTTRTARRSSTQYGQFAEPQFPLDMQDSTYTSSHCIWTDADCDVCTRHRRRGHDRAMARSRQGAAAAVHAHAVPADHRVRIEWDNLPEILISAGQRGLAPARSRRIGSTACRLAGSRRLSWSRRARTGALGTLLRHRHERRRARRCTTITDTTLDYDQIIVRAEALPGRSLCDHRPRDAERLRLHLSR